VFIIPLPNPKPSQLLTGRVALNYNNFLSSKYYISKKAPKFVLTLAASSGSAFCDTLSEVVFGGLKRMT
jgi:hypothetical protein